jgi:outer membrane protein OmpA-like peptidoglycan-associated protein
MKKLSMLPSLFALLLFIPTASAQNVSKDAPGCSDSPLITRIAGSTLTACHSGQNQQMSVPSGKNGSGNILTKSIEGDSQTWKYQPPKAMSGVQTFEALETLLKEAGFTIVYEESPVRLTAAKADTWFILSNQDGSYTQMIVTANPTTQNAPQPSPLANELTGNGRTVLYDIHFDPATGAIQADAENVLRPVLDLLRSDATLKIRVEAYTDNVGPAADNLALSAKEAASVVKWLEDHGVDKARLAAQGLGSANPVADNDNDADRAKNRRIEMVKM